jgi:cupin-like protein
VGEIARIESPGDDLFRRLGSQSEPVIICHALHSWKALSRWNLDYLTSVLGTTEVTTEVSATNYFPTLPTNGSGAPYARSGASSRKRPSRQLPFMEFAKTVVQQNLRTAGSCEAEEQGKRSEKLYLKEKGFIEKFPNLIADVPLQPAISTTDPYPTILWLGSSGTTTPLHYDAVDSLFAQVWGRKEFTLFAPADISLLYPFPMFSRISFFSRVEIEQPDRNKFPRFAEAHPFKVILEPGELLYLPAFWWHRVQSLDTAISVSYYRTLSGRRHLKWPFLRAMPAGFVSTLDRLEERLRKRLKRART